MSDAAALVIAARPTYERGRAAVAAELEKLPTTIVKELGAMGVKVVVCGHTVTDYATELNGVVPMGWPDGWTWDDVPGAYVPARNQVVIGLLPTRGGGWRIPAYGEGHGSYNLVVHETMHGFDRTDLPKPSEAGRFRSARDADKDMLGQYESQPDPAGAEETFAESAARTFAHQEVATPETPWPNLLLFWTDYRAGGAAAAGGASGRPATAPEFIGFAHLADDDILVLDLRADGRNGEIGHAWLSFAKDDRDRGRIEAHLRGESGRHSTGAPLTFPIAVRAFPAPTPRRRARG